MDSVTVEDNGRGIPVERHEKESIKQGRDVSALEVVMTIFMPAVNLIKIPIKFLEVCMA